MVSDKQYFVYILANKPFGVFYVGVTSDLIKRVYEHKHDVIDGFSKRYKLHLLVYYECHSEIEQAILREKKIKRWPREYKVNIVQSMNPEWKDLYQEITVC